MGAVFFLFFMVMWFFGGPTALIIGVIGLIAGRKKKPGGAPALVYWLVIAAGFLAMIVPMGAVLLILHADKMADTTFPGMDGGTEISVVAEDTSSDAHQQITAGPVRLALGEYTAYIDT